LVEYLGIGWFGGENRSGKIGIGSLTVAGHHYLRVPPIGTGDPAFFLLEDGSVVDGRFVIPAIPLSMSFGSNEALASFAVAYATAWQQESGRKEVEKDAVEVTLQDALAGEEKLMSLEISDIPEALAWFDERDPSGKLFRRCFSSTAGAQRASLAAHVELAKQFGVPQGERATGVALWNVANQFPDRSRLRLSRCAHHRVYARFYGPRHAEPPKGTPPLERQRRVAFAAATDVEALKQELGSLDSGLVIELEALPGPELLPRRPYAGRPWALLEPEYKTCSPWTGLLEIACGAGNVQCFRFLVEFCGLTPTVETMRQALAIGNNELVRDVWNRLTEAARAEGDSFHSRP
jgi:hypothetical protein